MFAAAGLYVIVLSHFSLYNIKKYLNNSGLHCGSSTFIDGDQYVDNFVRYDERCLDPKQLLTMFPVSASGNVLEECADVVCSHVSDPVCGLAADRDSTDVRRYTNLCHLLKVKCLLSGSHSVVQLPDSACGIKKQKMNTEASKSGRRITDFGIVGASQECNHSCPTHCVDIYQPVCARIFQANMKSSFFKTLINHCHVDLFSCSYARNVTIVTLNFCMGSKISPLQFMTHVAAMKSLDLIDDTQQADGPLRTRP